MRDVLDLPSLTELLRKLHSRELGLVEVETPTASPFASSLLFDYVATYMYEGDTPNAERRAAALALDRDLLRELLGQDELRELIDPAALEEVEAQLQHRTEAGRAGDRDALQQILRGLGDLTAEECAERVGEGYSAATMLEKLVAERRVAAGQDRAARSATSRPRTPASTATRSGCRRRRGCPEAFLEDHPDAMRALVRRYARTHGPFPTAQLAEPLRGRPDAGPARARARGRDGPRRAPPGRKRARVVRLRGPAQDPAREPRPPAARSRARGARPLRPLPAELAERRRPSRRRRRARPPPRRAGAAAGGGADAESLGGRRPPPPARRLLADLARRALHQRRAGLDRGRRPRTQRRPHRPLLPRGRQARRPAAREREDRAGRGRAPRRDPRAAPRRSLVLARPPRRPRVPGRGAPLRPSGTSPGRARSRTTPSPRCGRRGCARSPPRSGRGAASPAAARPAGRPCRAAGR